MLGGTGLTHRSSETSQEVPALPREGSSDAARSVTSGSAANERPYPCTGDVSRTLGGRLAQGWPGSIAWSSSDAAGAPRFPAYRVDWYTFPGSSETVVYPAPRNGKHPFIVDLDTGELKGRSAARALVSQEEKDAENQERATRRARVTISRAVRHGDFRYMWTFTFPEPLTGAAGYLRAVKLLVEWLHRRGGRYLHGQYVAVPELHHSGAWHWHIITPHRMPVELVRVSWTAFLKSRGMRLERSSVVRIHAKYWGSSEAAARYASKYVTKSLATVGAELPKGTHRYRIGDAVEEPVPATGIITAWGMEHIARQLLELGIPSSARIWMSSDHQSWFGPPVVYLSW